MTNAPAEMFVILSEAQRSRRIRSLSVMDRKWILRLRCASLRMTCLYLLPFIQGIVMAARRGCRALRFAMTQNFGIAVAARQGCRALRMAMTAYRRGVEVAAPYGPRNDRKTQGNFLLTPGFPGSRIILIMYYQGGLFYGISCNGRSQSLPGL